MGTLKTQSDFDLEGRRVLVVGAGRTGMAVVRFLAARGARVTLTDSRSDLELAEAIVEAGRLEASIEVGKHSPESFTAADLVVVSPGVPPSIDPLRSARVKGIPIVSEIELAARFITEPIVAVTGTNGKTTTATLLAEMFRAGGRPCFLGGNIGTPLIDGVARRETGQETGRGTGRRTGRVIVTEVSSFQLEATDTLRARAAILLNVAEDHMDRYADLHAYATAKGRIFRNQEEGDVAIYNGDDDKAADLAAGSGGEKLPFGRTGSAGSGRHGCELKDDRIVLRRDGREEVYSTEEIRLQGAHNLDNTMAAVAAARWLDCPAGAIRAALASFPGLPHRTEFVGEVRGIRFVNDSKGTNVDAVRSALAGVEGPVVLILGGQDKKGEFGVLREILRSRVKALVAYGEARRTLRDVLGDVVRTEALKSFREAVRAAVSLAAPGDTVLLSPGCASFDQFSGYAERGERFRSMVAELGASSRPGPHGGRQ